MPITFQHEPPAIMRAALDYAGGLGGADKMIGDQEYARGNQMLQLGAGSTQQGIQMGWQKMLMEDQQAHQQQMAIEGDQRALDAYNFKQYGMGTQQIVESRPPGMTMYEHVAGMKAQQNKIIGDQELAQDLMVEEIRVNRAKLQGGGGGGATLGRAGGGGGGGGDGMWGPPEVMLEHAEPATRMRIKQLQEADRVIASGGAWQKEVGLRGRHKVQQQLLAEYRSIPQPGNVDHFAQLKANGDFIEVPGTGFAFYKDGPNSLRHINLRENQSPTYPEGQEPGKVWMDKQTGLPMVTDPKTGKPGMPAGVTLQSWMEYQERQGGGTKPAKYHRRAEYPGMDLYYDDKGLEHIAPHHIEAQKLKGGAAGGLDEGDYFKLYTDTHAELLKDRTAAAAASGKDLEPGTHEEILERMEQKLQGVKGMMGKSAAAVRQKLLADLARNVAAGQEVPFDLQSLLKPEAAAETQPTSRPASSAVAAAARAEELLVKAESGKKLTQAEMEELMELRAILGGGGTP